MFIGSALFLAFLLLWQPRVAVTETLRPTKAKSLLFALYRENDRLLLGRNGLDLQGTRQLVLQRSSSGTRVRGAGDREDGGGSSDS